MDGDGSSERRSRDEGRAHCRSARATGNARCPDPALARRRSSHVRPAVDRHDDSSGRPIRRPTNAPETVRASREDVDYLLAAANFFFPAARLTPADVVAAWAGIRPLVASGFTGDPGECVARASHRSQPVRHDLGLRRQADDISIDGRGSRRRRRTIARQTANDERRRIRRAAAWRRHSIVRRSAACRRAGGWRFGRRATTRRSTRVAVARGGRAHDGGARARAAHRARPSVPAGRGRVRGRARRWR